MREGGLNNVRNNLEIPSAGDIVILKPDRNLWEKFKRRYVLERGALAHVLGPDTFAGSQYVVVRRYYNESFGQQRLVLKKYCDTGDAPENFDVPAHFFKKDPRAPSFLERKRHAKS